MDKNEHITIIRLKLCRPIGCSVEEFWLAINDMGRECDLARNHMLRTWQRWREDHPEWTPDTKKDASGAIVTRSNGLPQWSNCPAPALHVAEKPLPTSTPTVCRWCRKSAPKDGKPAKTRAMATVMRSASSGEWEPVCDAHRTLGFQTYLYQRAGEKYGRIPGSCCACLSREVWEWLTANAPKVPGNRSWWRWESLVLGESSMPTFRGRKIPIPKTMLRMGWDDCCWIDVPMLDGARTKVECKVANLGPRNKRVLRSAIAGELKIGDSCLVDRGSRTGDDWELHLIVYTPTDTADCSPDRTLVLEATGKDESRPFRVTIPSGESFLVGHGLPVVYVTRRALLKIKAQKASRRLGQATSGHGYSRATRDFGKGLACSPRGVRHHFCADLAHKVFRLAAEHRCGVVEYREPCVQSRDGLWFASRDTTIDWTHLRERLKSKLTRRGIVLEIPTHKEGKTRVKRR